MSYLVATTNEKGVLTLDFGVYYNMGLIPFKKASYGSGYMVKSHLMEDHILVWGEDIRTFNIVAPSGDTSKGLIVESVNGVTPTDLENLFTMITNVM